MIVYNTTFHIQADVLGECLDFLKNKYIPKALLGGVLRTPYLRRILSSDNDEGESFSVQFYVDSVEVLNGWLRKEGAVLQKELVACFKDKVVGFSTLLEEIDCGQ